MQLDIVGNEITCGRSVDGHWLTVRLPITPGHHRCDHCWRACGLSVSPSGLHLTLAMQARPETEAEAAARLKRNWKRGE